jgi:four helix bundle protein
MFLQLAHTKLDVYKASQVVATDCYRVTRNFPVDEKFIMIQQLRRAALSVHLNLTEGCSRKSKTERARFFEIARGPVIEIDACIEIAVNLGYVTYEELKNLETSIVKAFKLLTGMVHSRSGTPA